MLESREGRNIYRTTDQEQPRKLRRIGILVSFDSFNRSNIPPLWSLVSGRDYRVYKHFVPTELIVLLLAIRLFYHFINFGRRFAAFGFFQAIIIQFVLFPVEFFRNAPVNEGEVYRVYVRIEDHVIEMPDDDCERRQHGLVKMD